MDRTSLVDFPFSDTKYRFVSHETRKLFKLFQENRPLPEDRHPCLLLLCDIALLSYNTTVIFSHFMFRRHQIHTLEEYILFFQGLETLPPSRKDPLAVDLVLHIKSWELMTATFFIEDFSQKEQETFLEIIVQYPYELLVKTIRSCEPGKPISYLQAILKQRLTAQIVTAARREEYYDNLLKNSKIYPLPPRNPELDGRLTELINEKWFYQ